MGECSSNRIKSVSSLACTPTDIQRLEGQMESKEFRSNSKSDERYTFSFFSGREPYTPGNQPFSLTCLCLPVQCHQHSQSKHPLHRRLFFPLEAYLTPKYLANHATASSEKKRVRTQSFSAHITRNTRV